MRIPPFTVTFVTACMLATLGHLLAPAALTSASAGEILGLPTKTVPERIYIGVQGMSVLPTDPETFARPSDAGVYLMGSKTPREAAFQADVHLPDGARITGMACYHLDEESHRALKGTMMLVSHALERKSGTALWSVDLEDVNSSTLHRTVGKNVHGDVPIVDNRRRHYYVSGFLNWGEQTTGFRFHGCHIDYTPPE